MWTRHIWLRTRYRNGMCRQRHYRWLYKTLLTSKGYQAVGPSAQIRKSRYMFYGSMFRQLVGMPNARSSYGDYEPFKYWNLPKVYRNIQSVPRSKHSVSVIKTSQLMLYREIIAVCFQIHTKHINTLCGQNIELWNVIPGGTYRNSWALWSYEEWGKFSVVQSFWNTKSQIQLSKLHAVTGISTRRTVPKPSCIWLFCTNFTSVCNWPVNL